MVSKANEDLPEPDSPVKTTNWSRGISTERFLRLWTRAPCTRMVEGMKRPYRSGIEGQFVERRKHALTLDGVEYVAQRRGLLEAQLAGGDQHGLLDPRDLERE